MEIGIQDLAETCGEGAVEALVLRGPVRTGTTGTDALDAEPRGLRVADEFDAMRCGAGSGGGSSVPPSKS